MTRPLTDPQATDFGWGGSLAVRARVQLVPHLELQLGGGFLSVASTQPLAPEPGRALLGGAGLRVELTDAATGPPWNLWLDAQADVVGTGPLARFGWELGVGATFRVTRLLSVGPFVRFLHIVQPAEPGVDPSQAFLLTAGLQLELGGVAEPVEEPPPVVKAPPPPPPPKPVVSATTQIEVKQPVRVDRDHDGYPDDRDACPDQPEVFNGIDDEDGCPDKGDPLVVLTEDHVVLKQPVKFDDGTRVSRASYLLLTTAARVILLHPELRTVRVEAHCEAQRTREAAMALTQSRAEAVRQYLIDVGVPSSRLDAAGVGSDWPGEGPPNRVVLVIER